MAADSAAEDSVGVVWEAVQGVATAEADLEEVGKGEGKAVGWVEVGLVVVETAGVTGGVWEAGKEEGGLVEAAWEAETEEEGLEGVAWEAETEEAGLAGVAWEVAMVECLEGAMGAVDLAAGA